MLFLLAARPFMLMPFPPEALLQNASLLDMKGGRP
jgi:hypothetical protein